MNQLVLSKSRRFPLMVSAGRAGALLNKRAQGGVLKLRALLGQVERLNLSYSRKFRLL